jgi:hypothetical protein
VARQTVFRQAMSHFSARTRLDGLITFTNKHSFSDYLTVFKQWLYSDIPSNIFTRISHYLCSKVYFCC